MATAKINQVVTSVAGFLSGADSGRPTSPEYLEVDLEEKQRLFLVAYGPYGILPSFDSDCLTAMCWLKICGVEHTIEASNEPEMSPNGVLPFLMYSNGKTVGMEGIHEFGKQRQGKPLALKSHDPTSSVLSVLETTVRPALMYVLWLEKSLSAKITKRNYSRNLPWPVNELLMWKRRKLVRDGLIKEHGSLSALVSRALESLRTLSDELGNLDYFSGSKAGYVDAVAYGLFAVALVVLPPSHELRTMIETCTRLRAFVGRMRRAHFD